MKDKIQNTINNPYVQLIGFLCTISSMMGFILSKLKNFLVIYLKLEDNLLVYYVLCCLIIGIFVLLTILIVFMKNPRLYLDNAQSSKRIADYERLDRLAKKEIYIMGIGLNNIAKKTSSFSKMLDRDVHIILLILDPDLSKSTIKFGRKDLRLNDYFVRCYMKQLSESYDIIRQLNDFIATRKMQREHANAENRTFKGKIELRKYRSFIPMNITSTDIIDGSMNMVIEYCIPYSQRERIRFSIKNHHSKQIQEIANHSRLVINELMKESELISSDY